MTCDRLGLVDKQVNQLLFLALSSRLRFNSSPQSPHPACGCSGEPFKCRSFCLISNSSTASHAHKDELNVEQLFCATLVSFKRVMDALAFEEPATDSSPTAPTPEASAFDESPYVQGWGMTRLGTTCHHATLSLLFELVFFLRSVIGSVTLPSGSCAPFLFSISRKLSFAFV